MTLQIGNFKASDTTPTTKAPEAPVAPPQGSASAAVLEDQVLASSEALTALEAKLADEALTPAERYRKRLKDADISMEYAGQAFDDLIARGYHELRVTVRGRTAVFRTRTYEDHLRSVSAIELASPRLAATQEELQARYNMAASLVSWNGVTYKHDGADAEREFTTTMAAIKKFPAPVYAMLLSELAKFDAKMYLVFSEGAVENF